MTILFEPRDPKIRVVRVSHGEYSRDFQEVVWPQEATDTEWQNYLLPTGEFREIEPREKE